MKNLKKLILVLTVSILTTTSFISCGTTHTANGATTGAIVGGLVNGWEGAATGALVGGGVGLMVDSSEDKQISQQQKERELAMQERSKRAEVQKSTNKLTGKSYKVVSLVDEENKTKKFESIILSFATSTKANTVVLWKDGKSETYGEKYNIVGDALIFTGNDYVTNTKYSINGNQLILVSPTLRVVLQEV